MSKKGIMFTIMSVLVCALIITSFFTYKNISLDSDVDNTMLKVKNINRYVDESDVYIRSIASIAGEDTLDFTLDMMIGNNSFLNNYTREFSSCLTYGQLNVSWRTASTSIQPCPEDVVLSSKFYEFEEFSRSRLNIDSRLYLNSVSLEQEDPWNLRVAVNYTLTINDSYAFWNETRVAYGYIYIVGHRDPTYSIMGNQTLLYSVRYPMIINSSFPVGFNETPSTVQAMVLNRQYFEWNGAPSYLDRISNVTNNTLFSSSCGVGVGRCGIVSIVPPDFVNNPLIYYGGGEGVRSSLDFEFWKDEDINPYYYRRINFWDSTVSDSERYAMGVSTAHPGMNGTVLITTILDDINMTSNDYLDVVSGG